MTTRDFHGYTLEQAQSEIHKTVGWHRMFRSSNYYEYITGHGLIREQVFEILKSYRLDPSYKLGNPGVIVVIIE